MLENTRADNVKFTASEFQEISRELDAIKIVGERLPPFVQQFSDVEVPLKKQFNINEKHISFCK